MAEELEKEKRFPYESVAKLGVLGLMGVPYPEEYRGGGADTLSYALVIEELARFPMDARANSKLGRTVGSRPEREPAGDGGDVRLRPPAERRRVTGSACGTAVVGSVAPLG